MQAYPNICIEENLCEIWTQLVIEVAPPKKTHFCCTNLCAFRCLKKVLSLLVLSVKLPSQKLHVQATNQTSLISSETQLNVCHKICFILDTVWITTTSHPLPPRRRDKDQFRGPLCHPGQANLWILLLTCDRQQEAQNGNPAGRSRQVEIYQVDFQRLRIEKEFVHFLKIFVFTFWNTLLLVSNPTHCYLSCFKLSLFWKKF